jgi:hypothetical protein
MSTYWDVCCLDCDAESGLHLNHGEDTCRELVRGRDGLAALAGFGICDLELRVPGEIGFVQAQFYADHAGHVLAPVNEYGDIDGDCNELRSTGPHTTDGARCRLAEGHDGDHDFKTVIPWEPMWRAVREAAAARRRDAA